jgi:hypothetical protein
MGEAEVSNDGTGDEKKSRQPTPEQFYSDVAQVAAGLIEVIGLTLSEVKTTNYIERTKMLAMSARMLGDLLEQLIAEWQRNSEKEDEGRT